METFDVQVWKEIELTPDFNSLYDFKREFDAKRIEISHFAKEILRDCQFLNLTNKIKVKLARISVADLGFQKIASIEEIYNSAFRHHLQLCVAEVALWLRLNYLDQPTKETLHIATIPFETRGRMRRGCSPVVKKVLCLERIGRLLLNSSLGHPSGYWNPSKIWIFKIP